MPKTNLLLVLIVAEAALRSTLVARLALSGATVWTARSFDEKRPVSVRAPALLVTDEESIALHPAGVAALSQDAQWRKVVVLMRGAPPVSEDGQLLYLARNDAVPALNRLLEDWRRRG